MRDRVFAKLAHLDAVNGVGIANSQLAIYLARPLEGEERRHIEETIASEASGQPVAFVTTGEFKKQ